MSYMMQWFWLVQVGFTVFFMFALYMAFVKKWKVWHKVGLTVIIILLLVYRPIKLDSGTEIVQQKSNQEISASKELPPRIVDDNWKARNSDIGIKQCEIDGNCE